MSDTDNELHLKLVDGAAEAIAGAGFSPTVEERRAYAKSAVVAVLRTLADEMQEGWEDDVDWPDPDDLRGLAGEIEDDTEGVLG